MFGRKVLVKIIFRSKKDCPKTNVGPQKLRAPKNWVPSLVKKKVSNSGDIADMDKCCQDMCCLYKNHHDSWNLFWMFPGTYLL